MKRILCAAFLALVLAQLAAMGTAQTGMRMSNLVDSASQERLRAALLAAKVPPGRVERVLEEVSAYNRAVGEALPVQAGFAPFDGLPAYDPERIGTLWQAAYPDWIGLNCRLTAMSVLADAVRVEHPSKAPALGLALDEAALDAAPREVLTRAERARFATLFGAIPTEGSTDPLRQRARHGAHWAQLGVRFGESSQARMVSVLLHTHFAPGEDELLVGHVGVLLEEDEGFLFFEKLSFELPYQLLSFSTTGQLREYLLSTYDLDTTGESAPAMLLIDGEPFDA